MNAARYLIGATVLALLLAAAHLIAAARPHLPPAVNLIAFVDAAGAIYTTNPDGSQTTRVTPDAQGFFTWPTWSPDALRLAYSGVVVVGNQPQLNLYAAHIASPPTDPLDNIIYSAEPGDIGLLAQGVIHYPLWSPDGASLAFISSTSDGISLYIDDLSDYPGALHLLDDGPLWIAWSPDGSALAVHRADDHFLISPPGEWHIRQLPVNSADYRVPAWTPRANAITLALAESPARSSVATLPLNGAPDADPSPIRPARGNLAFLWAPGGARIAVADSAQLFLYHDAAMLAYRRLAIAPASDPAGAADEIARPVIAFFWSPDGSRLAYITLSDAQGALRCVVVDMKSRRSRIALDFIPSSEQRTLFQFFDQYAYSHSPWSPDSANLVFAGIPVGDAASASQPAQRNSRPTAQQNASQIIVASAEAAFAPQIIADGIMAFWSPR